MIVNDEGGQEIAMEASISSVNELNINGFLMPKPVNVIKDIEKIILNYQAFQNMRKSELKRLV